MARDDEEPWRFAMHVRMDKVPLIEPSIATILAQTWRSGIEVAIDIDALSRIWTYDFGWFDMETSNRYRDNLVQTGWLNIENNLVSPSVNHSDVTIPFGWMPNPRILENPPKCPSVIEEVEVVSITEQGDIESTSAPADPAAEFITELLDSIAVMSGLNRKEIMRRAQRKRRALGPVTLWMALLLVAREQKLITPQLMSMVS